MTTIDKCALGVIQRRGQTVIAPNLVDVGDDEAEFLIGHIHKARRVSPSSARGVFTPGATTPELLGTLHTTTDDSAYETVANTLQEALHREMEGSTAKDCVYVVVRAREADDTAHVTLLKLDAVVDAARMELISGHVTLRVLHELLPEPGGLQKALSWPDPRSVSQVIMHDSNFAHAQYFERACQAEVSTKSSDAEAQLAEVIYARMPVTEVPAAIDKAADLSGPVDDVLTSLAEEFPQLEGAAEEVATAERPAGIVRPNMVRTQRLVWRADGVELKVPPDLAASVSKERYGDGWRLIVETRSEPRQGT